MKIKFAYILPAVLGLVIGAASVRAQQPAANGDKAQQPASGASKQAWDYAVTSSIEIGVRGVSVDGNADKYRSDLNYDPGFRLFNSNLLIQSKNNDGALFDSLLVSSFGWGGDPSQYLRVNAEKTKWYRFDANYRRIDYFNSLRNFALNQHISNTQFQVGDFDLTLLPANERIRFNVGYSLDRNDGPSLTTYDFDRDEFPLLAPVRTEANDYRVGVDAKVSVLDISFLQGIRYFKEDTTFFIDEIQPGNSTTTPTEFQTFQRDMPVRGRIPYSRLSLHSFLGNRVDITARVLYTSATTDFELFETITGKNRSNNDLIARSFASGDAKRPSTIADLGVTVFATESLRVSNTLRFNNFQISGGRGLMDVVNGVTADELAFHITKYRRYENTSEVDYEFLPRFTVHGGYRFGDRHIERDILEFDPEVGPGEREEPELFDNQTHAGFFGFKVRPVRAWSLYLDIEKGTTDNVFTRVDSYDYTNFRARSIIRPTNTLTINTSFVTKDNNNPTRTEEFPFRDFGADINSRVYSGSVDWTLNDKFYLSSGYTYTHLTSEAQVVFFFNSVLQDGLSRYFLRDHFAFINTTVQLHPRARLFAGYNIHNDRGQGDREPLSSAELIGSFPLQFQSPEFRLDLKLTRNIDWVAGYKWYDYKEKPERLQNYNAHLPYFALRFNFDRGREQ
ncbi:MAG: hypothetical protein L0229_13420 [Blastocatellia bacterium]|nr:hypothetical protein [Blastocatellia bacterium]